MLCCDKDDNEDFERELTFSELVADSLWIILQQAAVYMFMNIARFFPMYNAK